MPPLLIPSPTILDQSFPRAEDELRLVAVSLSKMLELTDELRCGLLLTQSMREFVELFDWERTGPYPLLVEIHRFLNQLFLQPHDAFFEVDTQSVKVGSKHPIPVSCVNAGFIADWSEEVGKILHLHKIHNKTPQPHIGVACARAFGGEEKDRYATDVEAFPIIGPEDVEDLEDAYDWDTPEDVHQKSVSFALAKKNCHVIGATEVVNPSGSSHFIVKFKNQRSWPLDRNTDPVPERFLGQLKAITGYPLGVIKTALIEGVLPSKRLRIPQLTRL